MEPVQNKFDLADFITDSLYLCENIFPNLKSPNPDRFKKHPIDEFVGRDPLELLGFKSFGESRHVADSATGTKIQEFYRDLQILVTGGTGFLGKVLTEKLIRSIPHLGQIYVLMRAKKGVSAKERFEKLLQDEVFQRMRTEVPDFRDKLTLVEGDISEPELGLSEQDRQTLQNNVHIVFHSAADVRFLNPLRAAVTSNLIGSRRVIHLARGMNKLKSYIHVSTAYSNCVRRLVEEKIYKMSVHYTDIIKLLEEKSDDEINDQERRILLAWPNPYTFSKALCEDMIYEEAKGLPLCVFRPSIVGPSYQEPLRGWTDNIYGPLGLMMGAGLGVVHLTNVDFSMNIDMVPVDYTVNAMIVIAWQNASERNNTIPVYNYTATPRTPIIWKEVESISNRWSGAFPLQNAIWHRFYVRPPWYLEEVAEFILHRVPGYILDRIAVATGQQPRLTKIYDRLSLLREKLDYFILRRWEFESDKTSLLMNKLSIEDRKLFSYDIADINTAEYFLISQLGIKYFYLKESLDTIPDAARKSSRLKVAHYTLVAFTSLAALKLLVLLAHALPI